MSFIRRNQPQIRLAPHQPYTNSKLAVYVSTNDNSPVSFYVVWRRINMMSGVRQQIKTNEGAFYDASPVDYGCIIEVTVNYDVYGSKFQKILTFPALKINYQLQQRQLYVIQPIQCKLQVQEIVVDLKVIAKKPCLSMISGFRQFDISMNDAPLQLKHNILVICLRFEHRMNDFVMFIADILGWTPKLKSKLCEITFLNRLDRDLILIMLTDTHRQSTSSIKSNNSKTPRKDLLNISSNRNNKDKSLSANKNKDGKIKISTRVLKNNLHNHYKDNTQFITESLNVYQAIELQSKLTKQPFEKSSQLLSMDLRESFAELQTYNNSNKNIQEENNSMYLNSKVDTKVQLKGESRIDIKLSEQNAMLKQQNLKLKQQLDSMNILAKENIALRKKYMSLSQQMIRLQIQRKQILEDKLRFQSNFCRQAQQKQYFKKQLESLRQTLKIQSQRDHCLSPYNKHNDRPVTPDRPKQKTKDLKSSTIIYQERPRY